MRVKWIRRALLDLDEVEGYIARDNPAAAAETALCIARAVSLLQEQPGLGRAGRISGTRELVIPDSPYIVPYRVKDHIVQVLRIYHASRRWPGGF